MIPQILTNLNLYVDGRGFAGRVTEIQLPKLKRKTEEHRAGGMDGPFLRAGILKPAFVGCVAHAVLRMNMQSSSPRRASGAVRGAFRWRNDC